MQNFWASATECPTMIGGVYLLMFTVAKPRAAFVILSQVIPLS
jgi:hypothetical protein